MLVTGMALSAHECFVVVLQAQERIFELRGDDAARVIQRQARRMFARKEAKWEVEQTKKERRRRNMAAVVVQTGLRSFRSRQEVVYRRAVRKIQSYGRGIHTRKQLLLEKVCELENLRPELEKTPKEQEAAQEKKNFFLNMKYNGLLKYFVRRKQEIAERAVAAADAAALANAAPAAPPPVVRRRF